ncbi:DUF3556 domain-containing protein [Streptomyces sp. NPDC091281]|uniref:DUF3556 domain-containing protein n=1 Tax=Streptomyces sp. NPDC091281 TaxID=3365985 RepID=UPI00380ECA89
MRSGVTELPPDPAGFAPGEVRVITLEGQPIHRPSQDYAVHDAALGLLEQGRVTVRDMRDRQPWPTDGPDYPVHDVRSLRPLRPTAGDPVPGRGTEAGGAETSPGGSGT